MDNKELDLYPEDAECVERGRSFFEKEKADVEE